MKNLLALPQAVSKKAMETLNGKLVFRKPTGFNYIRFKLEHISQQFENLESQIISTNIEEFEQVNSLKQSVQKLETLYYRLLSTTILSSIIFGTLFLGMAVNGQSSFQKAQSGNISVEESISNR